jgi:hypothetical protein
METAITPGLRRIAQHGERLLASESTRRKKYNENP